MNKTLTILAFFITVSSTTLQAQSSCFQDLEDLRRAYYNGDFERIDQFNMSCLKEFSLSEKTEVYRYKINVALARSDDESALQDMANLLEVNPLFVPRSSERATFIDLFQSYTVYRNHQLGFMAGVNTSDYQIMNYHSASSPTLEPLDYVERAGISVGLFYRKHIWKGLYFHTGLDYQNTSYYQYELLLEKIQVATEETHHLFDFSEYIIYQKRLGDLSIGVGGGISFQRLSSAKSDISQLSLPSEFDSPVGTTPALVNGYDITFQRKRWVTEWEGVAQVGYDLGLFTLELQVISTFGINNLVVKEERFNDPVLLETFLYVPDDFKRDMMHIRFSVSRNVFKSKLR